MTVALESMKALVLLVSLLTTTEPAAAAAPPATPTPTVLMASVLLAFSNTEPSVAFTVVPDTPASVLVSS